MTRGAQPLFAVLRLDRPFDGDLQRVFAEPRLHIVVKEVLPTLEEAEQEEERLNMLNADKGCVYFASVARYFPTRRLRSSEA
jgi:hypothetical protein